MKLFVKNLLLKTGFPVKSLAAACFGHNKHMPKRNEIDEAGILSAIWILACNDDIPLMLYDSVRFRLGLDDSYDVESLIRNHGELFRMKCPQFRLDEWQLEMMAGKRMPSWIANIKDKDAREKKIMSLTVDDVFRSQFRARADSSRSEIDIINWGLEHIERLRKSQIESKDQKYKKVKEFWLPFLSILLAAASILMTGIIQIQSNKAQREIKEYELSYKPRQEGYSRYMSLVRNGFTLSTKTAIGPPQIPEIMEYLSQLDNAYYSVEPFLPATQRNELWETHLKFRNLFLEASQKNPDELEQTAREKRNDDFKHYETVFRESLNKGLFEEYVNIK